MPNHTFTLDEMITCVDREIGYRKSVYGRRVREGKMDKQKASDEIQCMTAVLVNLKNQKPNLFNQKKEKEPV